MKIGDSIVLKDKILKQNIYLEDKIYIIYDIEWWSNVMWIDINDDKFIQVYGTSKISINLVELLSDRRLKKINKIMKNV